MSQQLINGKQQFIDGNGNPLAGGSVYFYLPGTLTPTNTWADPGLTILNTNPVILDANGEASIWGADSTQYREVVQNSLGVTLWDQVVGMNPTSLNSGGVTFTQAGAGAVQRTAQSKLQESVSVLDFGADPTGNADNTTAIQNAINAAVGGSLFVPPGVYLIGGTITISSNNLLIYGAGQSTILKTTSATADMFVLGNGTAQITGCVFRDFSIISTVQKTAGWGFHAKLAAECIWDNVCIGTFEDNTLHGANWLFNGQGAISTASVLGPNARIVANPGYASSNSGSASVAAATGSISVNHGLSNIPSMISITPLTSDAVSYSVNTIGSSSFTVTLTASAPTGGWSFLWKAEF